jgi:hypothetical protein
MPSKRTFGAVESPPDSDEAESAVTRPGSTSPTLGIDPRSHTSPYANEHMMQESQEEVWHPKLFYDRSRQ